MKRSAPIYGLLALTISVSSCLFNPASAKDLTSYFKKVPGVATVDERQAQIEKRLRDAVQTGRLNSVKSQNFNKELEKIADLEASYRASHGSLSLWENLKILFELDKLSRNIEQSLSDRQVADIDLSVRMDQLSKRIDDGLKSHRLTLQESNGFKFDLDRIQSLFQIYGGSSEKINDSEALSLALDLDRLSARLESTMHDRQIELPQIDKAQSEIDEKIKAGIASGKISEEEATDLKKEFQSIADKEAKLKGYGRPLTSQETLALAIDLEKLSREVDIQIRDQEVEKKDYVQKRITLESKISQGVVSGKLTVAEAHYLSDQLEEITKKEQDWVKSGGTLTEDERKSLLLELEKLAISVERRLYDKRFTWEGISKAIAGLQNRIELARSSGRITESGEAKLTKELNRIKSNWHSVEGAESSLSSYPLKDSVFVVDAINGLKSKLASSLKDRDLIVPKLENRKAAVDRRIALGVVSGRLTASEGQKLLDQLDVITEKESVLRASEKELTDRERLSVALLVERLSAQVERAIHEGSKFSPSFEQRKQAVRDSIEEDIFAGKLTEDEAARLKEELARINALEKGFRGSNADLSATQALEVATKINELNDTINSDVFDSEFSRPDLEKRKIVLRLRVSEAVTSGKLTRDEATLLRKEFQDIADLEKKFAQSGGISLGEAATIAYKLEKLGYEIERRMHNDEIVLPSLANVHDQVDTKLANGVASGQLNLEDVKKFKSQLEDIARMEMGYRYSGAGLSYPETLMLTRRLKSLNKQVDQTLSKKASSYTGLEDRIDKTAKKIAEGVLNKKLSAEHADNLKAELDRISNAKVAFAHSEGGYSLDETETLVRDIDRLNSEIALRLKGQKFAWSDIDRRQSSLEYKLKQAIRAGRIKGPNAQLLKTQLDKIKRAKAAFTMSDGNLNYFERVSLGDALDRFDKLMKRTIR